MEETHHHPTPWSFSRPGSDLIPIPWPCILWKQMVCSDSPSWWCQQDYGAVDLPPFDRQYSNSPKRIMSVVSSSWRSLYLPEELTRWGESGLIATRLQPNISGAQWQAGLPLLSRLKTVMKFRTVVTPLSHYLLCQQGPVSCWLSTFTQQQGNLRR